ncbi:MAG: flagellar hook-basal body complex protein, partial [Planctomycetota bacterium]
DPIESTNHALGLNPSQLDATIDPLGDARGLLDPQFIVNAPGNVLTEPINISIQLNSVEVGVINLSTGTDLSAGIPYGLPSFPHIKPGDTITYAFSGTSQAGVNIDIDTNYIDDNNPINLTADIAGGGSNGIPDMFEENTTTDVNAWLHRNETNATFDWYRNRFAPEFASSSIEVFDAQGGSHILESRFVRTGTRTDPTTGARFNNWDMVIGVEVGDGILVNDVIVGLEFDQTGRYTGNIGTTAHGTALNDSGYVGNPSVSSIQVDWATTGPTEPASILLDLGTSQSYNGLTGFGSASTASAFDQDGFTDGELDSLTVSAEGDIVALYTNGISRKLARLNLTTFRNPAGLESNNGSVWQQTVNSGNPIRNVPGQNAGFITSGALEGGNVDIATEFSRMITAQRGFQVSARVIQTSDELLDADPQHGANA